MKVGGNELKAGQTAIFKGATTEQSVQAIITLIRESKQVPIVRETAENIISAVPERSWRAEMNALFNYVRANLRYTQDIENVETVKTPLRHLTDIKQRGIAYGDCDDATVLLGALLVNAGYSVRVVIIKSDRNTSGEYNHIYLYAKIPNTDAWVCLDATAKDKPFGFECNYKQRKIYEV
jgi:transglutaminase-like putative cysteine protease